MIHQSHPDKTRYLFVDGGCVRAELEAISQTYMGERGQAKLDWGALADGYRKVFYYDALPTRDDGETEEQYEQRNSAILKLHDELTNLDCFHVYEGDRRKAKGRRDKPQQKKVDVMIAVDMLMHTFRRNMHEATLIASDLDFAPLLHALVQEGMFVTLWYPPSVTKDELRAAADSRRPFTASSVQGHLRQINGHPLIPTWQPGQVHYREHPHMESWDLGDNRTVMIHGNGRQFLCEFVQGGHTVHYAAHNHRRSLLVSAEKRFDIKFPEGTYT
jgi:uncharacterized LabA/DUF88 family protein